MTEKFSSGEIILELYRAFIVAILEVLKLQGCYLTNLIRQQGSICVIKNEFLQVIILNDHQRKKCLVLISSYCKVFEQYLALVCWKILDSMNTGTNVLDVMSLYSCPRRNCRCYFGLIRNVLQNRCPWTQYLL